VSDCWAINDFHLHHFVTDSPEESAAMAIHAGCDLNCGVTYVYLYNAYKQGLVSEEEIRRAAIRVFTTRYLLGIMGEGSVYDSISVSEIESEAHIKKAVSAAEKGIVLLKNDGLLPLDKDNLKTVAVIGPNADSRLSLIGNYHGTSSRYVTVLEGLQDFLGEEVRVMYAQGAHLSKDRADGLSQHDDDRLSEAIAIAKASDVVILAVGLDETLEGEEGDAGNSDASGDKPDLLLPASQRRMIKAVLDIGKPTVICVMAGSAIDLEESGERAGAVLHTWYPGARGGEAVAKLLFGEVSPSGKLPVTFYRNSDLERMPSFTDYSMKGRTYRFMEFEALYPFGFGLTYGDVYVKSASAEKTGADVTVEVQLQNDGKFDTEDVVEIYCQNEGSTDAPINPRLAAFKRVFCPAGGEISVTVIVKAKEMAVINESGERIAQGTPVLYVGMGQPDKRTRELSGHGSVKISL
jgi:beta-glucosidase